MYQLSILLFLLILWFGLYYVHKKMICVPSRTMGFVYWWNVNSGRCWTCGEDFDKSVTGFQKVDTPIINSFGTRYNVCGVCAVDAHQAEEVWENHRQAIKPPPPQAWAVKRENT